jgi:hypothetical protein
MASRRRLSHNSECFDDSDEYEELMLQEEEQHQQQLMLKKVRSNRNSFGRMSISSNRSSMGEQSAEEQNRISEMYKTVIKMSSENVSLKCLLSQL